MNTNQNPTFKSKRIINIAIRVIAIIFVLYGVVTIALNYRDSLYYKNDEKEFERIVTEIDTEIIGAETLFETFSQINEDYRAWIKIDDSKINYPVLQAKDNEYYLSHRYNKEPHPYGAIFLDYRNISIESNEHIAIYGHSVNEKAMFGYLTEYTNVNYASNHSSLTLEFENEIRTYIVFSVRIVDADVVSLKINGIENQLDEHIELLKKESIIELNDQFSTDQLLTLVSCDNNFTNGRILVHFYLSRVDIRE